MISDQCCELSEYIAPVSNLIRQIEPSQDDSTERKNLGYFLKIIGKHAKGRQRQVGLSNSGGGKEVMQLLGYSSFCGLCAMNNAVGITKERPPVFELFDLDLAADILWLQQVCEVGCGFSLP